MRGDLLVDGVHVLFFVGGALGFWFCHLFLLFFFSPTKLTLELGSRAGSEKGNDAWWGGPIGGAKAEGGGGVNFTSGL